MGNIRNRHAAGTPLGGRFAPGQSAEPVGATTLAEPLDPREQALLDGGWGRVDAGGGRAFVSPVAQSCETVSDHQRGHAYEVEVATLEGDGLARRRYVFAVVPDDFNFDLYADLDDPSERQPSEVLMIDARSYYSNDGGSPADTEDHDHFLEDAMEAPSRLEGVDGWVGPGDVRNRPNPFDGIQWSDEDGIAEISSNEARKYAEVWGRDEAYAQATTYSARQL